MKKAIILASVAAGLLTSASAFAADMARPVYKAAPPPMPVANWTGFYIGANVGYGWSQNEYAQSTLAGPGAFVAPAGTTLFGGPQTFDNNARGWNGGGQIGYNWQFHPAWVAGIEADFQGADQKRTTNCIQTCNQLGTVAPGILPLLFPVTINSNSYEQKLNWFGTVRGRLGYTTGPTLFYVTGGFAYGEVERNAATTGTSTFLGVVNLASFAGGTSVSSTKTGWVLGGGIESEFAGAWTLKAEYLYMDLGSVSDTYNTRFTGGILPGLNGQVAGVRTVTGDVTEQIVRVGLNYRFNR
jgi:outer membrane immunogenic protein